MPRMSKKRKLEWSLFLNERGRITCNDLCRKCFYNCKQSYRAILIECPRYLSKRSSAAVQLKDGEDFSPCSENITNTPPKIFT